MTCITCNREAKTSRLPTGWHRRDDASYCAQCWRERFILRAVTMPVVEPLSGTWEELRANLREQWAIVTNASNWIVTELYARDVRRNGEDKMPPMARVYLYPEIREKFPALAPQTVCSLEQSSQRRYRAARYETIWTAARSLPTFRYPVPLPVHNQSWSCRMVTDRPVVIVRIGENRWELRLMGGPRYRRQLVAFRQMIDGAAQRGELAILKHHDGQILVKMVAWFPRGEAQIATGTLYVRTVADALLVAVNGKDERIWTYNADHLRRWVAEHRRQLQRWAEDSKFENRPVQNFAARREVAVRRFADRMKSAVQMIAAMVCGYANRRKFSAIEYDDSERGYCPEFQYFALASRLATKCDEMGIEFRRVASGEMKQNMPGPLAEE